jgi:hypothetical protein
MTWIGKILSAENVTCGRRNLMKMKIAKMWFDVNKASSSGHNILSNDLNRKSDTFRLKFTAFKVQRWPSQYQRQKNQSQLPIYFELFLIHLAQTSKAFNTFSCSSYTKSQSESEWAYYNKIIIHLLYNLISYLFIIISFSFSKSEHTQRENFFISCSAECDETMLHFVGFFN